MSLTRFEGKIEGEITLGVCRLGCNLDAAGIDNYMLDIQSLLSKALLHDLARFKSLVLGLDNCSGRFVWVYIDRHRWWCYEQTHGESERGNARQYVLLNHLSHGLVLVSGIVPCFVSQCN